MTSCPRSGCKGAVDEDGFCDLCGLEAPASSATASPGSMSTPTSSSARTTTASHPTAWTTPSSGSGATARSRRGSTRSTRRGLLGRGIVEVPSVPKRDPREAVMDNPEVPENKRFCSKCGTKVGRGREGRPGRVSGFCAKCGHHFDFTPKLAPGDMVAGQYEVLGCIAHGGLGWIYLALDRAVDDRWVVLKGLLDTGDADAMAAAMAERRFLAQVEHPNIVRIINFAEHQHDETTTGYIVMEYVGGESIKDMVKRLRTHGDQTACLPLTQAIAYTLEILPALGYLHGMGLVYCDFKPDNVIQVEEQLKLIDLGAVRHVDDENSPIYGTTGYQAPEVGKELPSPVTDVYTVGRALAVMTFPFDFHATYKTSLPGAAEQPLLAEFESYYRLLLRATHKDPAQRFPSAEEMRDQLEGVFREVAAAGDGQPRAGISVEFTPERRSFGVALTAPGLAVIAGSLPIPRIDASDPGAAFLAGVATNSTRELVDELKAAPVQSVEVKLRLARAYIELGDHAATKTLLNTTKVEPGDWRLGWHRGLAALTAGSADQARMAFESVYDMLPGEAAPKLAIAACAEASGDVGDADQYYRTVWRTDRSYISAAFGLARALLAKQERGEAVDVLNSVPDTSSHHVAAQLAAIRARTGISRSDGLSEQDLVAAGGQLAGLELDDARRAHASRDLLESAYSWVRGGPAGASGTVLGCRLVEDDLRRGLEKWYRTLARQAPTRRERIALVDHANRIRPKTWI
ncbi:serine/threonine-protein kinase [Kibdelosporangium phytohabitans]|uniref:non-specific serine/threonine protein kinase n=1 Tax=Kibdelosporangium phytohabitans TaxID=860235 RepID=A0A0N9HSH7_9PSEU|nr:serine/threonine-protein kinase [Kibdelosporangium phytohabitans]ALG07932.1 serine/threonine protein kinase [Kibdelosporangium phytohabitans]MBE1471128.1 serine/threonine-protein kinase PknG [Kibdelosporangium phytohabitans]